MDIQVPSTLSGKNYPAWMLTAVDKFIQTSNQRGMWPTIDLIVKVWMKKNPKLTQKHKDAVTALRNTRLKSTGASRTLSTRALLEVPTEVMALVRVLYKKDISENPQKFYRDFAKRYKIFRIPTNV